MLATANEKKVREEVVAEFVMVADFFVAAAVLGGLMAVG